MLSENNNQPDQSDDLSDDLNLNDHDTPAGLGGPLEGAWDDEDDDDFDDQMETRNDLNEIRVGDDLGEPDPEDDDHLPDDDLQ
ncbi:hypothetical protein FPZ43_13800 [Mucilaginibacter pallidiroseus]|uniref:Uncharacterized protein n=1 Tax=Mucilaginibacter pallidiroseus TaxID=2599295 RepID=A0A563U830_9SPHI|nr:hypothetical protein [Mucilaginibacter pallidiroseus]TWR27542.1 hypothetical protein FPZ43_13800 [Mucilaginibacter pallidiroseus]